MSKLVSLFTKPCTAICMQALTERDLGVTKREQDFVILEERLAGRELVSFPPYKLDFKFSGSTEQRPF
jgi:hypothetical protein